MGSTSTHHIQVLQNISYSNIEGNISGIQNMHTDGDGIIIDSFHNEQGNDPTWTNVNFPYPTRVENNLVFNNGARGIIVYESDHVTVRNNTAFHNNVDRQNLEDTRGELSNANSSSNTWENNIGIVDKSVLATVTAIEDISAIGPNAGVQWLNNLTFNGTAGQPALILQNTGSTVTAANGNQLGVDPEVVRAAIDSTEDFHLKSGSPAAGAGTSDHAAVDLVDAPRAPGPADLGAYAVPVGTAPDAGTSPDAGSSQPGLDIDGGRPAVSLGVPGTVRGGWGCSQSSSPEAIWPLVALVGVGVALRRRSRSAP